MITRSITKLIIPFILAFALYIQIQGENTPGGGFQAGLIIASALILYGLVFGNGELLKFMPISMMKFFAVAGVMLYMLTGMAAIAAGGEFLNYFYLAKDKIQGQHLGIFMVELGVGITVFAVITMIYITIAEYNND
jgi:multicomponent Na+:H+ antiporter subunit B